MGQVVLAVLTTLLADRRRMQVDGGIVEGCARDRHVLCPLITCVNTAERQRELLV